jgi:hypothetical protein
MIVNPDGVGNGLQIVGKTLFQPILAHAFQEGSFSRVNLGIPMRLQGKMQKDIPMPLSGPMSNGLGMRKIGEDGET